MVCYVCETDLSEDAGKVAEMKSIEDKISRGKKVKEKDKDRLKPGLVELSTQGTGFAGGGNSMVAKEGVVFQC